ncbi:MAG: hypothetical protein AAGJ46_14790 [Planctomycetota bacterium]
MLKGHAAQRAIAAWHAGRADIKQASGEGWMRLFLSRLLDDPYSIVRYIAADSVSRLPGYEKLEYDSVASEDELDDAAAEALAVWLKRTKSIRRTELLATPAGTIDGKRYGRLYSSRNNRPIRIKE